MRAKKKEAKFFCESCGNEVPRNSKTCPSCGKFFASVRCPNCGRTGNNDDFLNGCPTCGYAVNPDTLNNKSNYVPFFQKSKNNPKRFNSNGLDMSLFTGRNKATYHPDSSLPFWIYAFTVIVLIVLVFCLYSCL